MPHSRSLRCTVLAKVLLGALFLAASWFYAWSPSTYPTLWSTRTGTGLYSDLTKAFFNGHLYLARNPDPKLVALPDPYDPAANAAFRINDLSYFRGHYYLYHGAAPVVMLFAPYHALTGHYLTDPAASLIFGLLGAAFGLLTLAAIWSRVTTKASWMSLLLGALAILFCQGYYLVIRDVGINQVAIASAFCFVSFALWSAIRSLFAEKHAWSWLLLAATAYGLAIASRPSYVFGSITLLVPVLVIWRRQRSSSVWKNLAAVVSPLLAIISGILTYNYLRFGQLLEFGQRYMLGAWDQRTLGFFSLHSLKTNLLHYLITPGIFSLDFPFLSASGWQAVGVLIQSPFVWLALPCTVLLLWRAIPGPQTVLRSAMAMIALVFLCNFGLLLLLPSGNEQAVLTSANARYSFDFLPALVLLTSIGILGVDDRLADRPWSRCIWCSGTMILVFISLLAALSLDFSRYPAENYRSLAQVLNRPTQYVQRWLGMIYGPLELQVVFPPDKSNFYEPLVTTGSSRAGDLLYVNYDSPETVRFGLVNTAMKGPLSPPIRVSYGQPHHLTIRMGSLYPAGGNPLMSALTEFQVARLKRTLQIDLDGHTVYEVPAHFSPSKSYQVEVGTNHILEAYSRPKFSGRVLYSTRLPISPLKSDQGSSPEYGTIRLVLRFPSGKPGTSEPLVESGLQNAGDIIYVTYENDWQITLGLDHWGHMGRKTTTLPIDYSVNHVLEIQMGSLFPPRGHVLLSDLNANQVDQLKGRVRLILDREVVLDVEQPTYDSSPYDVFIGRNVIGASTCVYEFSGEIKSATRLPLDQTIP